MSVLTIFLGIVIFILLFTGLLYLYNRFLGGAVIYDLKKTNPELKVSKPKSSNYYFSVWIYVNSFKNEDVKNYTPTPASASSTYSAGHAEQGKPIFYYGEGFDENPSGSDYYILDGTNNKSKSLVYLQLGANSPKLQYYYTTDTTSNYKFINITESLPIQKWTHVIISTVGGVLEFYLDGKLINTIAGEAPKVSTDAKVINIGKRKDNITHDTFISRLQRVPQGVDAKTAFDLYKKGPGTGLNMGSSKYDFSLKLTQNDKTIKTISASSIANIFK
jgi:hypothetical protein